MSTQKAAKNNKMHWRKWKGQQRMRKSSILNIRQKLFNANRKAGGRKKSNVEEKLHSPFQQAPAASAPENLMLSQKARCTDHSKKAANEETSDAN